MKLERSKNAIRNIKASFISKIVSLICPFIVRTVFIKTLGAEFLGVNSLFSSILSVLSLTELGFGSAIVFNMYKAIADDDDSTINALLYFYRKVYRYVGCIIFAIGLILIPFLPYLVNGSYPDTINATVVYLIFLGNTVISYFMYAYLQSLLSAFQRNDVITVVGMYMNIVMYALQIVLLVTVKNYYAYLAIMPVFTILSNIRTAIVAHKLFPQYKPVGKLSKEVKLDIREKVSGILVQKICSVTRNSIDSIFISMFLGLTQIAIYNNYYYIMNSITAFMTIVTSSILSGVGNSIASDSKEKNYQDMGILNFVYMWLSGWCAICLLCLYQNFMQLWVGKDLMLSISSVILLCIYFYLLKMGDVRWTYEQAKGLWWQSRHRAFAQILPNIALNYFLGKYFGINGIIAATLISIFVIEFCCGSHIIYKYYFTEQKLSDFFLSHGFYLLVTVFISLITYFICSFLPTTIIGFGIKIIICVILPNIIYLLIYRKTKIYKGAMPWTLSRIGIKENSKIWKLLV
jgi:O-antigen/teichoic acid export membrane protein